MLTMTKEGSTLIVRDGKRTVGSIINIANQTRIPNGWRFIPNRRDIAARYPAPSPAFATPERALADVNARLD